MCATIRAFACSVTAGAWVGGASRGFGRLHRGRRDLWRFFDDNGERRAVQFACARDYFYLARTARASNSPSRLTEAID